MTPSKSSSGRAARGGQSRPPGTYQTRLLWEIGSWGNASDHIGQRWEQLGQERLQAHASAQVNGTEVKVIVLVDLPDVQSRLQSMGLTNPDALVVDHADGRARVRPIDFKWSLETASYRQVSGEALRELTDHPESPLPALLVEASDPDANGAIVSADGWFFAPDSRTNREFLSSRANEQQEYPLGPEDVRFEVVDGHEFFSPLPWWPMAERLAALDRMESSLGTLDGAERYYRLGAGVGGGIQRIDTSIFASEPSDIDVYAVLDSWLADARLRSSQPLIDHVRRQLNVRNERVQRLKVLLRSPWGYREMVTQLAQRGITWSDDDPKTRPVRERWTQLHRQVTEHHRAHLNETGLREMEAGASEAGALASLERGRLELEGWTRALAQKWFTEELAKA